MLQAEAQRNAGDARIVVPYIRALYDAGDYAAAFAEAKRLQQGNSGASAAHVLVADVAAAMGNYDEALDALEQARSIRFSEPVMLRMVEVLRAKGAMPQSGEVLAQYLSYNPSNVAGLRWMAYSHLETESWAVAASILENLRKRIGENDALIMAGLTQAYIGLGQTDKAIAAGRIAYRVQPSSPVVSHLYGLALMQDGERRRDGISLLKKAVAIMPDNPVYRQSLQRARARGNDHSRNGKRDDIFDFSANLAGVQASLFTRSSSDRSSRFICRSTGGQIFLIKSSRWALRRRFFSPAATNMPTPRFTVTSPSS